MFVMHAFVPFLLSADTAVGRFNKDSLPEQTRMELLMAPIIKETANLPASSKGLQLRPKIFDTNGDILPVCSWVGVLCNNDRKVDSILWMSLPWLMGKEDFHPETFLEHARSVVISHSSMRGTLDLSALAPRLADLDISYNSYTGGIQLSELPTSLEKLNLSFNSLEGSLNLENLPAGMKKLNLSRNKFLGSVSLVKLPDSLTNLFLQENNLTGTVSLRNLPQNLECLELSRNKLSGPLAFANLPVRLFSLGLKWNNFDQVDVKELPSCVSY